MRERTPWFRTLLRSQKQLGRQILKITRGTSSSAQTVKRTSLAVRVKDRQIRVCGHQSLEIGIGNALPEGMTYQQIVARRAG